MRIQWLIGAILFFSYGQSAQAKVYRYVRVGEYNSTFELKNYQGQSFLKLMKDVIYPAIIAESVPRFAGAHFDGIKQGVGVELRLTDDVTTYHVKFDPHWVEDAERSGRSFAGVDSIPGNGKTEYVADASYKHYLTTLEELFRDTTQIEPFYRALFKILLNCDPSGVSTLSLPAKQVMADFVAVYVAEQYRHLLSGEGQKLGRRHNWDNAHLQVTLLAAFHAGQSQKAMYYKGHFMQDVYLQKSGESCIYQSAWQDIPENHRFRPMNLTDYWQFNEACERSGVNLTRRDFQKLGRALSRHLMIQDKSLNIWTFNSVFQQNWTRNFIESIANVIIDNQAPDHFAEVEEKENMALSWIMATVQQADSLNDYLKPESLGH